MLLIMVYVFSCMLFEIEFDTVITQCRDGWLNMGVGEKFLVNHQKARRPPHHPPPLFICQTPPPAPPTIRHLCA